MKDSLTYVGEDPLARSQIAELWGIARFDFHEAVDSTQNVLRRLALDHGPDWTLVVADHQIEGRGQHGRRWLGDPGSSLMFSLLLRTHGIEETALLPVRVGLSVARALDGLVTGASEHLPRVMLKWPNDLIIDGAKIGGILCEGQIHDSEATIIVGIGLNILPFTLQFDARRQIPPGFLAPHLRPGIHRLDILGMIVRQLRADIPSRMGALDPKELADYGRRDWLYGRTLREPVEGQAMGITANGHLRVMRPSGTIEQIVAGRVVLEEDRGG
jgi:BirA family biotin operon repressor/biotin-[acetyl-CoA-carboxylase] ligase